MKALFDFWRHNFTFEWNLIGPPLDVILTFAGAIFASIADNADLKAV